MTKVVVPLSDCYLLLTITEGNKYFVLCFIGVEPVNLLKTSMLKFTTLGWLSNNGYRNFHEDISLKIIVGGRISER